MTTPTRRTAMCWADIRIEFGKKVRSNDGELTSGKAARTSNQTSHAIRLVPIFPLCAATRDRETTNESEIGGDLAGLFYAEVVQQIGEGSDRIEYVHLVWRRRWLHRIFSCAVQSLVSPQLCLQLSGKLDVT